MTYSYNTSVLKSYRSCSQSFYQIEVEDFDNETITFEVEARNFNEANSKGAEIASANGIEVYNMNIYKI